MLIGLEEGLNGFESGEGLRRRVDQSRPRSRSVSTDNGVIDHFGDECGWTFDAIGRCCFEKFGCGATEMPFCSVGEFELVEYGSLNWYLNATI